MRASASQTGALVHTLGPPTIRNCLKRSTEIATPTRAQLRGTSTAIAFNSIVISPIDEKSQSVLIDKAKAFLTQTE